MVPVFGIPEEEVCCCRQQFTRRRSCLGKNDNPTVVLAPKHLVQQRADEMHVLVADLDEDAAALSEQVAGGGEAVAQVAQVAVDAQLPGVAERLDLLRLPGQILGLGVLHVALAGAHLPVAAELDAVGRVEVDALHMAAQPLLLREAGHYEEAVAEDQPVRPVLVVLVELQLLGEVVQPVEVGEQVGHGLALLRPSLHGLDDGLGVNLLLHVDRHRTHFKLLGVQFVLPLPDELRVERAVAVDDERLPSVLGSEGGGFARGDVRPLVLNVLVDIDGYGGGLRRGLLLCHRGTLSAR